MQYSYPDESLHFHSLVEIFNHYSKLGETLVKEANEEEEQIMAFIDKVADYEINPTQKKRIHVDFNNRTILEERISVFEDISLVVTPINYSVKVGKKRVDFKIPFDDDIKGNVFE